jgi:hypothetical protein
MPLMIEQANLEYVLAVTLPAMRVGITGKSNHVLQTCFNHFHAGPRRGYWEYSHVKRIKAV